MGDAVIVCLSVNEEERGIVVDDGETAVLVTAEALEERNVVVQQLHDAIEDCTTTLRGLRDQVDEDIVSLLTLREWLHRWDLMHILGPFLRRPHGSGVVCYIVVCSCALPALSVNSALFHAFRAQAMSAAEFCASFAHVAHSREGFEFLRRRLPTNGRVPWNPAGTSILLCPREVRGKAKLPGSASHVEAYLERYPEVAIQPAIVDALMTEIQHLAERLGMRIVVETTRAAFLDTLAMEDRGSCSILVAHNHGGKLQMADGFVSYPEIARHLLGSSEGGAWFLAVCQAEGASALAGILQSADRPIIFTPGSVAVVQDQLGFIIELLRRKVASPYIELETAIREIQIRACAR